MDPQHIVAKVDAMLDQLEHAFRKLNAAVESADFLSRHTMETASRTHALAITTQHEAELTSARADSVAAVLADRVRRTTDLRARCEAAQGRLHELVGRVGFAREKWGAALIAASNWLVRAQARESAAAVECRTANTELASAEAYRTSAASELASARQRIEYVGNDSRGNPVYHPVSTVAYEAAVARAMSHVIRAKAQVATAEAELRAAGKNRMASEARVQACRNAVHTVETAAHDARRAEERAAAFFATLARVTRLVAEAEEAAAAARQSASDALRDGAVAVARALDGCRTADETLALYRLAAQEKTSAQHRAAQGATEIGYRLEQLKAFDRNLY